MCQTPRSFYPSTVVSSTTGDYYTYCIDSSLLNTLLSIRFEFQIGWGLHKRLDHSFNLSEVSSIRSAKIFCEFQSYLHFQRASDWPRITEKLQVTRILANTINQKFCLTDLWKPNYSYTELHQLIWSSIESIPVTISNRKEEIGSRISQASGAHCTYKLSTLTVLKWAIAHHNRQLTLPNPNHPIIATTATMQIN